MAKEYYLYIRGQKVKVSEDIYIVYWREKEHEKYLEQVDRKNHLLFFSALDHDGHFTDNIVDESVDVEKIVETQMMIEAVRSAITRLNAEERDIIERLYFNDETVRSVAKLKSITHPALIKRRNKILEKLKNLSKNFKTSVTKGTNFPYVK
ncbi:sigma-70 family RNA polymerase sigma factor [Clostridioides difficile]|nr:sigma-70 family RNA polymerase sigma factor [Clostridioides difficile]